jgi:hypothetical protein
VKEMYDAQMEEMRTACKILVGKTEEMRTRIYVYRRMK